MAEQTMDGGEFKNPTVRKVLRRGGKRPGAGRPSKWEAPTEWRRVGLPAPAWAVVDLFEGSGSDRLVAALLDDEAVAAIREVLKSR